ncbi:MAG: DUF371 domain-containing protein [Thermoprotei archaeon]|nr:MAG: DUF371 domain-containing protein [Thermoprotei archaeon]
MRTKSRIVVEELVARGHPNVQATHRTTFEITKETFLTPRGDCIIAVCASKGAADLSTAFKEAVKRDGTLIVIELHAGDLYEEVRAYGSKSLILTSPFSMVVRKSDYIDPRTIAIRANKAAADLKRELIDFLKDPRTVVRIVLKAFLEDY